MRAREEGVSCGTKTQHYMYTSKKHTCGWEDTVCADRKTYIHKDRYAQIWIPTIVKNAYTVGGTQWFSIFTLDLSKLAWTSYPPAILFTVHPLNLLPLLLSLSLVAGRQLISALSARWLTFTAVAALSR